MAEESFRNQWKNFLKEQGSLSKAAAHSFKVWKEKYQGGGSKVLGKPLETFNEKMLIPGKIYSFVYAGLNELKSGAQFVDHWPIVFSMGNRVLDGKVYETGIDLNLVPPKVRPIIIEKLHNYYKAIINKNASSINEGKKGKKSIRITFKAAQVILAGTGFERAYVSLFRAKMGKIKVYDYADWVRAVPLYTGGVRGKSINKIYSDYVRSMGQNKEEKRDFVNQIKNK